MTASAEIQNGSASAAEEDVRTNREQKLANTNKRLQAALDRSIPRRDVFPLMAGAAIAGAAIGGSAVVLNSEIRKIRAVAPELLGSEWTQRSIEGWAIRYDQETFIEGTQQQYAASYGQMDGDGNVYGLSEGGEIVLPIKRAPNGDVEERIDTGITIHSHPQFEEPELRVHMNTETNIYLPVRLMATFNPETKASIVEFYNRDMPQRLRKIPVVIIRDLEDDGRFFIQFVEDNVPDPRDHLDEGLFPEASE